MMTLMNYWSLIPTLLCLSELQHNNQSLSGFKILFGCLWKAWVHFKIHLQYWGASSLKECLSPCLLAFGQSIKKRKQNDKSFCVLFFVSNLKILGNLICSLLVTLFCLLNGWFPLWNIPAGIHGSIPTNSHTIEVSLMPADWKLWCYSGSCLPARFLNLIEKCDCLQLCLT